jgi:hypothetical protein
MLKVNEINIETDGVSRTLYCDIGRRLELLCCVVGHVVSCVLVLDSARIRGQCFARVFLLRAHYVVLSAVPWLEGYQICWGLARVFFEDHCTGPLYCTFAELLLGHQ